VDQQEHGPTWDAHEAATGMDDWQGWLDDEIDQLFADAVVTGASEPVHP
jgi:hypothetical protein